MHLNKVRVLRIVIMLVFVMYLAIKLRKTVERPLTPELFEILTKLRIQTLIA
jgi:hypothetical protein